MTSPVLPLFGFLLLAGCGGNGSGPMTTPPPQRSAFDAQLARGTALTGQLDDMDPTRFSAMPTSGTATFSGVASLSVDPVEATVTDDILVLGDVTATADFGQGTLRGRVENLQGGRSVAGRAREAVPVSGSLQIGTRESVIGNDRDDNRVSRPNGFYVDYRGQITLPDGTYAVDGAVAGQFIGTRTGAGVMPIRGLSGAGEGVAARGTEGTPGFVEYGADLDIAGLTPARP